MDRYESRGIEDRRRRAQMHRRGRDENELESTSEVGLSWLQP